MCTLKTLSCILSKGMYHSVPHTETDLKCLETLLYSTLMSLTFFDLSFSSSAVCIAVVFFLLFISVQSCMHLAWRLIHGLISCHEPRNLHLWLHYWRCSCSGSQWQSLIPDCKSSNHPVWLLGNCWWCNVMVICVLAGHKSRESKNHICGPLGILARTGGSQAHVWCHIFPYGMTNCMLEIALRLRQKWGFGEFLFR